MGTDDGWVVLFYPASRPLVQKDGLTINLQNIPRSEKVVKRAFVPKLDAFLFFDYAQIEYRILAYYIATAVGDTSMAEVFKEGKDLHAESAIAALSLDREPTDEERQVGKTFNFATVYGQGVYKCAATLGVEFVEAKRMLNTFYDRWPNLKQLNNPPFRNGGYRAGEGPGALQRALARRGYIQTLWGRKLHPEQPHKALNALIQGCAADLMRAALVKVHDYLTANDMRAHLVNVIHDELIIDCLMDEVPDLVAVVPRLMDHPPISEVVPVEVDVSISTKNWAEKASYESGREQHDLESDHRPRKEVAA